MNRSNRAIFLIGLAALAATIAPVLGVGCGTSPAQNTAHPGGLDGGGTNWAADSASTGSEDATVADSGSNPTLDAAADSPGIPVSTVFTMDPANVVRSSNIVLSQPNTTPQESMALGNGTLGIAAWAASGFTAQLNRADTFPARKALSQLTIPGLAPLTTAADFHGQVDLYDAMLEESGGGMTATVYVRADAPEIVIDVTGADPTSTQTATLQLWSGRSPAGLATGSIATLSETWQDNAASSGRGSSGSTFRVVVGAPAWTGGDAMATATTVLGSDATAAAATLSAGHLAFWHDYWSRVGLVKMTSSDGGADYVEALRTLYLFYTAAESRGALPGSQAGLADLFDFLQDEQPWLPAAYWVWNLRMQVAANMGAGAFDLNTPVFNLYLSNLAAIESWTATKMGIDAGICLPETMRFNGNGYWYGAEGNSSCDQAASPSYNALTLTSGAEVGLWVWRQYQMTGDVAFLTANYPLMAEAARFLLASTTTGSDGLLHTTANAHETQWDVTDPVTDVVAMEALFPAVVSAAAIVGTDAPLATELTSALAKLPPLPRTDAATHMTLLTAGSDDAGTDVFALSYEPAAAQHNAENLDLEAVWPYDLIGDDGPYTALAQRTYASRMFVNAGDWSFDAVDAARLGLGSEVLAALSRSIQNYQSFVNGLAILGGGTNDGTSDPYVEELGIVALAVNEAAIQDYDGLLRIGPGWPSGWDGEGSVFIQNGSKVDFQIAGGQVTVAIVEAGSSGTLLARNPWTTMAASVIDGTAGTMILPATSASPLSFPTEAGHWYAILPATAGGKIPVVNVSGTPATAAKMFGTVQLGL